MILIDIRRKNITDSSNSVSRALVRILTVPLVQASITNLIPGAVVLSNKIPKEYVDYEMYNNLVYNEDAATTTYEMLPRLGCFEVSYKGYLIFSKLGGGYWPNVELVTNKCATIAYHEPHNCDFSGYLAGMSPDKAGFC
jgi:hypothetical protein